MIATQQDTAVVILSYNSLEWHRLFLPLIVSEAQAGYEVVVVDHNSTDGTAAWIQEHYPTVHVLKFHENHGFAWGYATALKQITAKYYVLLSADFEVTPGWFQPLHHAMEADYHLAAIQPKIRYYKDREYFEYAGASGGFMDHLGYMFCRGRVFDTLEKDHGQYDDPIEVFWASGGCLFVRSAYYHEVGGLDDALFAHMEEIDLCWRLKNAGYKIGVVPQSTVFHVGGSVISYGSPQKTYYNFRNNLVLLYKNERSSRLLWLMPLRLVLDGVAGLQFLLKGQIKNLWAIVRAHFSFYGTLGIWTKKRKANKLLLAPQPNTVGIYPKSIILDYFLKKKKRFSDLDIPTHSL